MNSQKVNHNLILLQYTATMDLYARLSLAMAKFDWAI